MTKIQKYTKKDGPEAYEFNVYLGKTDNGKIYTEEEEEGLQIRNKHNSLCQR